MTREQLDTVGTILAIILFICAGPGFAYKGLETWKQAEQAVPPDWPKIRWGKTAVILGITLFVLAIIFVAVLIVLVKNGIIVTGEPKPSPAPPAESTEPAAPAETKTAGIYVSNQLYHGAVYSGYVNKSRQPNGRGTMKYSDGTEYTGDWVDGIRQGQGTMKYDNGTYDGEWQNDKKNGEGTYTWNDGKQYKGAYVDDVRSGDGVFSNWVDLTNGYIGTYYGESKNDQFNGLGSFRFDNGDQFEGVYKENQYWTGTYTRKDGSRYKIINGQPQY